MSPAGIEPAIPESERSQTRDSDCAVTGIGFGICESKLLSVAVNGQIVISAVSQVLFIGENLQDCEIFTVTLLFPTT
jgi:hypothetical protein